MGDGNKGFPYERLGDFRLVQEIGRGASGTVFAAVQEPLSRRVAVKVLSSSFGLEEKTVARFHREAEALAKIQHRHIVPIYHVGQDQGLYFYAMELIEGRDVQAVLRDEVFDPFRAAKIARDTAAALHTAHAQGIIHRDIKPANLILNRDDDVRITDFGLAKMEHGGTITESGTLVGTPMYMSPEQALGKRDKIGPCCDVYSLGATLYEMITGRPIFDSESFQAVLHNIAEVDPVPPRKINPALPRDLETVTLKALQKDPDRRYSSAEELAADLHRFLCHEPVLARRSSLLERGALRIRKNIRLVAVVAPLILTLVAVIAYLAFFGGNRDDQYMLEIQTGRIEALSANYDEAFAALERAKKKRPQRCEAYLFEGQIKAEQGNYEGALAAFDQGVELAPDDPQMRKARADYHLDHANYEEAERDYSVMLNMDPDDTVSLARVARILYHHHGRLDPDSGARERSIRIVQQLLAMAEAPPEVRVEALRLRALAVLERPDLEMAHVDSAYTDLREAIDLDPLDTETNQMYERVLSYRQQASVQKDSVVAWLQWFNPLDNSLDLSRVGQGLEAQVNTLQTGLEGAGTGARRLFGGLFRRGAGDPDALTLEELDQRISEDPADCDALLARGAHKEDRGDFDGCARDYQAAINACRDRPESYYRLGRLHADETSGMYDLPQAEYYARQAVSRDALDGKYLDLLVAIYRDSDRLDQAKDYFRKFFLAYPEHADRTRIESDLGL